MVRHIVIWKLKEELIGERLAMVKQNAKEALEALTGQIPGLLSATVQIEGLASSNGDMMLDTAFTDEAALLQYQKHPLHQAAADTYVRPYTHARMCMDFVE